LETAALPQRARHGIAGDKVNQPQPSDNTMSHKLRVLIIEDNPDDLELVVHYLREHGLSLDFRRVDTADSMNEALSGAEWDIILSDYHLPCFNACAALAMLHASGKDIPFIVVSGTIGEERAVELMQEGADDFVHKEHMGRLSTSIDRAIANARMRADRARAIAMLHATNHELSTLVEASPLAIVSLGPSGTVRSWNAASIRLLGWSAEEAIGMESSALEVPPNRLLSEMREAACLGRTCSSQTICLRRKDGRLVDVSVTLSPLGSIGGCLLLAEDISERKRLESMLFQAQKMEAIGQLAGGVAHDFNNLLTVIMGFGERLQNTIDKADRRRRPVDEICRAAERASILTRQLLTFSRKQMVKMQAIDVNSLVRQLEGMLQRLINENIHFRIDLSVDAPIVNCDPSQIEMVIMNMVVNARDAMPMGGQLIIETSISSLSQSDQMASNGLPAGRYVLLRLTDTGIGMETAVCERIFEPFFTTKEPGHGTGLGLATAFGVIRQSGGQILVESTPGKGSTFTIYLPLLSNISASGQGAIDDCVLQGSETILVVEDDGSIREMICSQLRDNGYRVLCAASAEEAMDRHRSHPGIIHLLLTDVMLPGMNGISLALELTGARPQLKVMYMSGYADDTYSRNELASAGDLLLRKPFRPNALLASVRGALLGNARSSQ
jgi:PAS domain S-box-containing protein